MIIRDSAGVEVLELGDNAFVGGYLAKDYDEGDRTHRRVTTEAARVNSAFDVAVSLNRARLTLTVEIEGASHAEIRSRRNALLAAVEVMDWILDVGDGISWRCGVADSRSPRYKNAPATLSREVVLTIPAHPATYGY